MTNIDNLNNDRNINSIYKSDKSDKYADIVQYIQQKKPNFSPKIGLILGSGLGELANDIQHGVSISYSDIPDFPQSTVTGHKGQMVLGSFSDMPVVCMQGRIHGYEGAEGEDFKVFIRTLKLLGCEILIITNAAGSLQEKVGPGDLSLITDHINMFHRIPLIGFNEEEFGQRFFDMTHAYDKKLQQRFHLIAKQSDIILNNGVYIGTTGPCFETPAEIKALRLLGADLVGMSTIPETLVARHCGLRVAAISTVTNYAAGMDDKKITHEDTLYHAKMAASHLARLIRNFITSLRDDPC